MAKTKLLGSEKEAKLKAKKRQQKKQKKQRKSIIRFFKEVYSELKKVTWPTFKDLVKHTSAVIIFILVMGAIIFVVDTVLSQVWKLLLK
ncbi:MAG: preprotein translocase subunit SecE [Eubacteriales bacterium]